MVTTAEDLPDPEQRCLGLLAHEVHRYLARKDDLLVTCPAFELVDGHAVIASHGLRDPLRRQRLALRIVEDVLEDLLRELRRDG